MTRHPAPEELQAYASATLSETDAGPIEAHLAECAECRDRLRAIPPDSTLELLRRAGRPGESSGAAAGPAIASGEVPLRGHPRYELIREVGRGGMGVVFEAHQRGIDRRVAVKILRPELLRRPDAITRFRREAKAAGVLAHPNIVTVYDADESDGVHFLVTEFVEGIDLAHRVHADGPLAVNEACEMVRQSALALQYAHERGMAHRDIKPSNLMRTAERQIKVLDFGLATLTPGQIPGSLTELGDGFGSPDFIAPEQVRDAGGADARSDIYSLGCTLYFLLTGQPPFPGGTAFSKVAAHLEKPLPRLAQHLPNVPEGLQPLLDRMTAKDPTRRYQSAREIAAELERFKIAGSRIANDRPLHKWQWPTVGLAATAIVVSGLAWATQKYWLREQSQAEADRKQPIVLLGHTETVRNAAFSPDGSSILTAGCDRTLRLWNASTGQEIRRYVGPGKEFLCCTISPDGVSIAGGSGDATTCLWQIDNAGAEDQCLRGHTVAVHQVSFSRDGKRLLTAGLDGTVRIWNVATGTQERCFRIGAPVNSAMWSPGETTILVGRNDKLVQLLNAETGEKIKLLSGHTDAVMCVCFLPDGKRAISAGHDATMRLWDLDNGKELRRYDGPANFACVAVSLDGKRALVGGWDRIIRLWDIDAWREIRTYVGHTGRVSGVAFSPDGKRILSCGQDNTGRVWGVEE